MVAGKGPAKRDVVDLGGTYRLERLGHCRGHLAIADFGDQPRGLGEVIVTDCDRALRALGRGDRWTAAPIGALVNVVVMDQRCVVEKLDRGRKGGGAQRFVAWTDARGELHELGAQA